ncbi:MAG: hypothetical protein AAF629_16925 [Chloroflexota bacterium]
MSKRKRKRESAALFERLTEIAAQSWSDNPSVQPMETSNELRLMKKFRFQLLHRWMTTHLAPCKVADIGGGKGLLTYLLQQSGWQSQVIDPVSQELPTKYKDIVSGRQIKISTDETVSRIDQPFDPKMVDKFDLLVGVHAHGCNMQIIDSVTKTGRQFILMPCCIIDEPVCPSPNTHWLECVLRYALEKGAQVKPFQLNFRGQNIGFYGRMQ